MLTCACVLVSLHVKISPSVAGNITVNNHSRDRAAFAAQNYFYVSNSQNADPGTNCLARIVLERKNGVSIPTLSPLSPFELTLNGTWIINNGTTTNGYTSGQTIQAIAVAPSGDPVIVTGRNPAQAILIQDHGEGTNALINTGDNLFTDTAGLTITAFPTMGSNSLAAGDDYIFLDVPTRGPAPSDNTSVIVSAKIDQDYQTLTALAPVGLNTGTVAQTSLSGPLSSKSVHHFSSTLTGSAGIIPPVGAALYWDDALEKLYVGIDGLEAFSTNTAVSLLVGDICSATGQLKLNSVIGTADQADSNNVTRGYSSIIAMGASATTTADLYVRNINVMHTSTGKPYIIINGGGDMRANNPAHFSKLTVYALPIVYGSASQEEDRGHIASKNNFNVRADATTMPYVSSAQSWDHTGTDTQAIVGYQTSYLAHDAVGTYAHATTQPWNGIQNMQVTGDTVYVSMAGINGNPSNNNAYGEDAGIFSSTALFDETGKIYDWTPWERAANTWSPLGLDNRQSVTLFGIDEQSGNAWFLKNNGATAVASQWSKGDNGNFRAANTNLASLLDPEFANNGIWGIFNFDAETPGFRTSARGDSTKTIPQMAYDQFSMMIVTGNGRVALVETMSAGDVSSTSTTYGPTKSYDSTNTFTFDERTISGKALINLGPITCAEVSRSTAATNNGWVFVGGEGGLAVLRNTASSHAGEGWQTAPTHRALGKLNLNSGKFPGNGSTFQFAQILMDSTNTVTLSVDPAPTLDATVTNTGYGLKYIRKLIADGKFLYILTKNTLLRLDISSPQKFAQVSNNVILNPANATEKTLLRLQNANDLKIIASVGTLQDEEGNNLLYGAYDEFIDMVLLAHSDAPGGALITLGTTRGLFVSPSIPATPTSWENPIGATGWTKPISSDGSADFSCGNVLKMDFIGIKRGASYNAEHLTGRATGNLYVTATDAAFKHANVYRFNVYNGTLKSIQEPYLDKNGNPVDYFYQIGSTHNFNGIEWNGNLDRQGQALLYEENGAAKDFIDGVSYGPDPLLFLAAEEDNSAINLGVKIDKAFNISTICKDTASGSHYINTNCSIRVNE